MVDLEAAGSRVRAALEDMFGAVARIGAAFAAQHRACLAAGAALSPDRLSGMREVIWRQLALLPGADGAGVVAAPGVVAGKQRHLEWWQRAMAADGAGSGWLLAAAPLAVRGQWMFGHTRMCPNIHYHGPSEHFLLLSSQSAGAWAAAGGLAPVKSPGVQPDGVLAHDLAPQPRGHRGRQRPGRRVEVPVRVVG